MMLMASRVIAVDDDQKHLDGLAKALNQYGVACLQFHFTGDTTDIKPCPHVRVIFADLHLGEGPVSDPLRDFSIIGGFIEEAVKPSGPYFIVLWTRYPDEAGDLQRSLEARLQGVAKPFAVLPLDKAKYLDEAGNVRSTEKLVETIAAIAKKTATDCRIAELGKSSVGCCCRHGFIGSDLGKFWRRGCQPARGSRQTAGAFGSGSSRSGACGTRSIPCRERGAASNPGRSHIGFEVG